MVLLIYIVGTSSLLTVHLIFFVKYVRSIRSKSYPIYGSRIPNLIILIVWNSALVVLPATFIPDYYFTIVEKSPNEQYLIILISICFFHTAILGIKFIIKSVRNGAPRSFIIYYYNTFFNPKKLGHGEEYDNLIAFEYSVIGALGGFLGTLLVYDDSFYFLVLILSGFISCLVYHAGVVINRGFYYE